MPLGEGRSAINFSSYQYLARLAMFASSGFKMAIYAHVFLLFCWNLLARNVSVFGMMYDHIWWEDDCIVVVFVTQKNDKEAIHSPPKHVYANPEKPELCPLLAFAIYLFTTGYRREDSKRTVFGTESKSLFGDWLKRVMRNVQVAEDLLILGMKVIEIGTHSFRKGVAGFLSGIIDGPNPIAIYLRAGWSLGRVQSRYILECSGGDRLCGRAATGLCLTEQAFACLPPHFDMTKGDPLSRQEWEDIVPSKVKECVLENFQVNGAVQVTVSQVEQMLVPIRDAILENNRLVTEHGASSNTTTNEASNQFTVTENGRTFNLWQWNSRIQHVPESFRFPKTYLTNMWHLWWEGNNELHYRPYRHFRCFNLSSSSDRQLLSKAKFVMTNILEYATNPADRPVTAVVNKTRGERQALFKQCFESVIKARYPDSGNEIFDRWSIGQVSYITFYDLLKSLRT
mmetsp:Transcript_16838/g.28163  ORF Transcript_16838/g.28163 Transcript_16838/m.28163 type:complete len:455 (-) Transcript_16838:169-1533(-)